MPSKSDLLIEQLKQRYSDEKEHIENTIEVFNERLINEYTLRFPKRFISKHILFNFVKKLSSLELLPSEEKYIELNILNEFFDITISFVMSNNINNDIVWTFPYPLNINKATEYIVENHIPKTTFKTAEIAPLINHDCYLEYDLYMESRLWWGQALDDIKAKNPIILLQAGGLASESYLINGTHRTIQAINDSCSTIEGYVVSHEICKNCGMTNEYILLYKEMLKLCESVRGIDLLN